MAMAFLPQLYHLLDGNMVSVLWLPIIPNNYDVRHNEETNNDGGATMADLFAPRINKHIYGHFGAVHQYEFRWICAVFSSDGAVQIIKRAKDHDLASFYPIRRNHQGEYVPMWRPYLFVQWKEGITINLCRTTAKFIKIISARGDDGIMQPVLVRRCGVAESLRLVTMGKFDEKAYERRFYGKGSIVLVREGNFLDKKVTLEIDVPPYMNGRTKVPVVINGIKAKVELYKLVL
jgi:hypothetical protein